MAKIKITQTKSAIDKPVDQKRTIEALGLGRTNYFVVVEDNPAVRGMIRKVSHLLKVENAD
ncbi:MAG: 50S ribosomal protein L30 [Bacteroidetes bacterium]|nr:50S ribosomal protein L30 [Bacteroidota bacterium]